MPEPPLLSIAIPTYNRAKYLDINLQQLLKEIDTIDHVKIEIIVSDNCSTDNTKYIVQKVVNAGLPVKYYRNPQNLGWGINFFKCFDLSTGKYVLLLGDDDFLYDGVLSKILGYLLSGEFGIVFLKPYGFDNDFRKEYPGAFGKTIIYNNTKELMIKIGPSISLLSACIINKSLIKDFNTSAIDPGNFAHLHLILFAIQNSTQNLYIGTYCIGSKRNNSSSYIFSKVFVTEFWQIIDKYRSEKINRDLIRKLENDQLFSYYPYYLTMQKIYKSKDLEYALEDFSKRFSGRRLFMYWVAPIIRLYRIPAILWGVFTVVIGRIYNGDLIRGIAFVYKNILKKLI
jgi:abequosyltransferase